MAAWGLAAGWAYAITPGKSNIRLFFFILSFKSLYMFYMGQGGWGGGGERSNPQMFKFGL